MSMQDRRLFLKRSVAALSVPFIAESNTLSARSAANVLTLGVMGVNGRGSGLAGGFSSIDGCEVGYICDVDPRAIGRGVNAVLARKKQAPKQVTDFRRILDDKSVDVLVIAAPDHWHGPATILACAAG